MVSQYADINFSEKVKIFLEKINAELLERGMDYSSDLKYPPYIIVDKRRETYYIIGVVLTESVDMVRNVVERVSSDDIVLESIYRLGEYIEFSRKNKYDSIYAKLGQYSKKFAVLVSEELTENMIFFLKSNTINSQRALIDGKYSFFFFNDEGLRKILNIYYELRDDFKDKYERTKNIEKTYKDSKVDKSLNDKKSLDESRNLIEYKDKNQKNDKLNNEDIISQITEDVIAKLSAMKPFIAEYIRNYEKKPIQRQITYKEPSIVDSNYLMDQNNKTDNIFNLNKVFKDNMAYSLNILLESLPNNKETIKHTIDSDIEYNIVTEDINDNIITEDDNNNIVTEDDNDNIIMEEDTSVYISNNDDIQLDILLENINTNEEIPEEEKTPDVNFIITSQNTETISKHNTETIELEQKLKKAKKNRNDQVIANVDDSTTIKDITENNIIGRSLFFKRKLDNIISRNSNFDFINTNISILIENIYNVASNSFLFFPTYTLDRLLNNNLPQAILFLIATLCTLFIGIYKVVLNAFSSLFVPKIISYAQNIESIYMKKVFDASHHILSLDNYLKSDNILNGINLSLAFNKSMLYFLNSSYYLQYILAFAFFLAIIPMTRVFAKKMISFMLFLYIFYYPIFIISNYGIKIILSKAQTIPQLENNFLAVVSGIYVVSMITPIIAATLAYIVSKNQKKDFD